MYSYHIKRLIKKQLPLLLIILLLTVSSKIVIIEFSHQEESLTERSQELLDTYVKEAIDLNTDEKLTYINKKITSERESYMSIESPSQTETEEYNQRAEAQNTFKNSVLFNSYTLLGVKKYAETGEGLVSLSFPENISDIKEAYLDIHEPNVVNESHFKRFISLQSFCLIPFYILFIVGIFIADSYEKKIDLHVIISGNSKLFFRSQEIVLSIFIFIMLIINIIFDLAASGLLSHLYELSVPIQSISDYVFIPHNLTVLQAIIFIFLLEVFGAFICYNFFAIISKALRSMKNYIICGLTLIALTTLTSGLFPDSAIYMMTGITNKRAVLRNIQYIPSLDSTNILIVFIVCLMILTALCSWRLFGYLRKN